VSDRARVRFLLFDVDDTLYHRDSGVLQRVDARIEEYLRRHFPLPKAELRRMRTAYWQKYGTTLGGLVAEHRVDADEYLAFIHDVPVESLLQEDPGLDALLAAISPLKVVFTNSCREHALRVLRALGIERHFSRIWGIREMDFTGKPDPQAYLGLLAALGAEAGECVFIDDSEANLRTANELGIRTVQIGADGDGATGAYVIEEIGMLRHVAADLGLLE